MWGMPNGFLVPYFPESTSFLRPYVREGGPDPGSLLWTELEARVKNADTLYSLETGIEFDATRGAILESLALTRDPAKCESISTRAGASRLCVLNRIH
jgi:hypothetical protein